MEVSGWETASFRVRTRFLHEYRLSQEMPVKVRAMVVGMLFIGKLRGSDGYLRQKKKNKTLWK
jgi:hypothetical protein